MVKILLHVNVGILICNDASIKCKDVKTDHGSYFTYDKISVLSVAELGVNTTQGIFYTIMYVPSTNKTIIRVFYPSSHVTHTSLNNYLDNNRDNNIIIGAIQTSVEKAIPIRLYYI